MTYANLPPTSSKADGESVFSTTFNTDYDTIPVTRSGATITIGTIPVSKGGTGSSTQNFVDLTTNQTVLGVKTFSDGIVANVTGNATTVTTNADLTGDVTSVGNTTTYNNVVPVAKGGTNSSAALTNSKVIESRAGAVQESLVGIDASGGLTVPTDITLSGAQFNNTEIGYLLAHSGSTGVAGGAILTIDAITSRWDLSAQNLTFANNTATSNLPALS